MNRIFRILNKNSFIYIVNYLRINGIRKFILQVRFYLSPQKANYSKYIKLSEPSLKELTRQRNCFDSITDYTEFHFVYPFKHDSERSQLLDRLRSQTYRNWDLISPSEISHICSNSKGDYFIILGRDVLPSPDLLFTLSSNSAIHSDSFFYFDEDIVSNSTAQREKPHFKSDYNISMLNQTNYIGNSYAVAANVVAKFFTSYKNVIPGDYDFMFLCCENCSQVIHIPKVLFHYIGSFPALDTKMYTKAVYNHLARMNMPADIMLTGNSVIKVNYKLMIKPLISIIIPNKDHRDDLKKAIDSVLSSSYTNFEIIIVENNSTDNEIFKYYEVLSSIPNIKIITWDREFNYSAINNYAVKFSNGEYLLFLNNDVEVINRDWLEEMLQYAQQESTGIVGSLLLYPDNTIQHAGCIVGIQGIAGHAHKDFPVDASGYQNRIHLVQEYSCVTAACMMIRKTIFDQVNGFDEEFPVAFNDMDFCLRVRALNKLVIYTPYSRLYHYESKSRGTENTPDKLKRFHSETQRFHQKWKNILLSGDPYYNCNLTLTREDFSLKRPIELKHSFFTD